MTEGEVGRTASVGRAAPQDAGHHDGSWGVVTPDGCSLREVKKREKGLSRMAEVSLYRLSTRTALLEKVKK